MGLLRKRKTISIGWIVFAAGMHRCWFCFASNKTNAYFYIFYCGGHTMHIQYESYKDILDEKIGFGKKIVEEIIDNVVEQVTTYCHQTLTTVC